jgi:hypothetical protein
MDSLVHAHPAVLRNARLLKRPWRKDIDWTRGMQRGLVLQVVNVSEAQMDRALRTFDTVVRGADAIGWHFESSPHHARDRSRSRDLAALRTARALGFVQPH